MEGSRTHKNITYVLTVHVYKYIYIYIHMHTLLTFLELIGDPDSSVTLSFLGNYITKGYT